MKKQLLLLVMMLLPMVASADAVEINGIYYNLVKKVKTAEVTYNPNKYTGRVVIPNKVSYDDTEYDVTSIEGRAFSFCSLLTTITIPSSVTSIGEGAFYSCFNLDSVRISDIGAWCNISFSNYDSNPLLYAHHLFLNGKEIKDLVIPNNMSSIGNYVFSGCSGLTSITIPNSVTSIGTFAFSGCSGLISITIPNSVTNIEDYAFSDCSGLASITIPNSVTSIGSCVFLGCSGLTSITIPNSVTSIESSVFYGCSGLTSITIPNSVTSIGDYAFSGCSGLISITIPNSVTTLGRYAFSSCSGLTSITIGSGVKEIYNYSFFKCPGVMHVYCLSENVPTTSNIAFEGSYIEYATLHVPAASVDAYKAVKPWSGFKAVVALGDETPDTPENKKCEIPTISYMNGQLKFTSATKGAEFVTDITDADIKKHYDATISLTATYNISVYATKSGYENSDVATATLCWIESAPKTEGITDGVIQVPAKAVLIQSIGGTINVQGVENGMPISVYSINGNLAGAAVSQNGEATINTTIPSGNLAIVKIGEKSVKVVMK